MEPRLKARRKRTICSGSKGIFSKNDSRRTRMLRLEGGEIMLKYVPRYLRYHLLFPASSVISVTHVPWKVSNFVFVPVGPNR